MNAFQMMVDTAAQEANLQEAERDARWEKLKAEVERLAECCVIYNARDCYDAFTEVLNKMEEIEKEAGK